MPGEKNAGRDIFFRLLKTKLKFQTTDCRMNFKKERSSIRLLEEIQLDFFTSIL